MADTGWIRFKSFQDPQFGWSNETNLLTPNSGECTSTTINKSLGLTANFTLESNSNRITALPEGSVITGFAYRFRAKYTGTGTAPVLSHQVFSTSTDILSTQDTTTLTTTFQDYTFGGSGGDLFGLRFQSEGLGVIPGISLKVTSNPDSLTVVLEGSEADTFPAVKIFYDEPPANTQNTGWLRFGNNVDDSDDWLAGNITSLLSGNTGFMLWLSTTSPLPYFIFNTIDSTGIPSNATITGIQASIEIDPGATTNQTWDGKLSTTSFGQSDITDEWFDIDSSTDPDASQRYITGSYNNLFDLSLTPTNADDLVLGFKNTAIGISAGFGQLTGNAYAPAIKIFYTQPPPTGVGANSSILSSGTITLTSGRITIQ